MKRFLIYTLLLTLFFTACEQPTPVPNDSLSILSGVSNNTLTIDGAKGSQTTFSISSKLAWEVLDTPGVVYSPANGEASTKAVITATATEANNTLQTRKLGDVIIRLSRTRFTGIVAYQRPQIVIEQQYASQITVAAVQGHSSKLTFECSNSDFEVITEGDIECGTPTSVSNGKYSVSVSATKDNSTATNNTIGYISFKVNGDKLDGKIAVVQQPAIAFSSSRVLVNGIAGASSTIEIVSPFDFTVSSSSAALTAVRGQGNSIILTTNERNSTAKERVIAKLTVALKDNPSCKASIDVYQRKEKADHALLFFLLGTSLKGYYQTNIDMVESIVKSGTLQDSRAIVFMQDSQSVGSIFEIYYDPDSRTTQRAKISTHNLPALYDAQMLTDIFKTLFAAAPAKEYGLYIGSHGKGWIPKASSRGERALALSALEDLIWTPMPGAAMVRHIGDSDSTRLNITELAAAITATNCHLSYIIFDACYMSNIESAYDLKDTTDYILASPCEVMASGMPYNDIVPIMISNAPLKERLDNSAKAFVDYYKNNKTGIYSSACSAVINCSELDNLAATVKQANNSHITIDPQTVQFYDGISASRNPTHIFFDLEHYVTLSCTDAAAVTAFTEQMARTVSGQYHTTTFYSAYNNLGNAINYYSGVTTSAPILNVAGSAYKEDWKQTAWYKVTH